MPRNMPVDTHEIPPDYKNRLTIGDQSSPSQPIPLRKKFENNLIFLALQGIKRFYKNVFWKKVSYFTSK